MSRIVSVLPLTDIVLLPGMIARVQVSRPAHVAVLNSHAEDRQPFIAVPLREALADDPRPEDLGEWGCLARTVKAVDLGDGTMRALVEGLERVRVVAPRPDPDLGIAASFRVVPEEGEADGEVELLARRVTEGLKELIGSDTKYSPALQKVVELPIRPGRLADQVAANLTLTTDDRLVLLAEPRVDRRLRAALVALGRERQFRKMDAEVQKEVQATTDKQNREFYLREQIRGLKKELGEAQEAWDDTADIEQKLRDAGLPAPSLEEALRELERLRRMHPDAAEWTVTRTWLDWLVQMPWKKMTPDNQDLASAARVLDEDHYGLDKVKQRILEYLAVRKLKPDGKGPILCFVGPPGVGKTSLGKSIARALGRNFQRASLGGVKDEAEIRGHRRTYVGALPGRIAHAVKRAGSRNPVIVLDELDKLGSDFRGDPASALLEALDPEQNVEFVDHYLDVPFDLSQALFLCTANLVDPIPAALHDRLEIIELPGYIQEEKIEIARRYLLPRLHASHGLTDKQIRVTARAVRHIIEAYTDEAGVRGLERQLAAMHRKAARMVVEGRKRAIAVDGPARIKALIGPPRHFPELADRADVPGVAIGLAWTATGGDILFIEATSYPGGKGLKLTGKLGDVMKESAEAAMSFLRAHAREFGISPDRFKDEEFHVHVPAGAIQKDGPSAGITLVTALASLLSGRKVRSGLAMTGEITLRGKVLPVGGVREKVLAARRAQVKVIVLPRHNEHDLDDVPALLRNELTYHFIDRVEEALVLALEPAGEGMARTTA